MPGNALKHHIVSTLHHHHHHIIIITKLELVHMTGPESDYLVTFHTHTVTHSHTGTHTNTQWSSDTVNRVYVIRGLFIRQMAVKWGIVRLA